MSNQKNSIQTLMIAKLMQKAYNGRISQNKITKILKFWGVSSEEWALYFMAYSLYKKYEKES